MLPWFGRAVQEKSASSRQLHIFARLKVKRITQLLRDRALFLGGMMGKWGVAKGWREPLERSRNARRLSTGAESAAIANKKTLVASHKGWITIDRANT